MNRNGNTIEPLIAALAMLATTPVVILQSRFDPDLTAFCGAVFAAIITVLEAVENQRTLAQRIMVFLSSAVTGSILPGAVVWQAYPERFATLSWHAWGAMGLFSGLLGWAVVSAVMGLRGSVAGFLGNLVTLFLKKNQ